MLMSKIVEIIGPSGSGKSSVYNGLKERWEYGLNWVTFDHLNYSPGVPLNRMVKRGQRILKNLIPQKKSDIPKPRVKEEWKFVGTNNNYFLGGKHEEFKSVLMDLIEDHCKVGYSGTDKRFITAYMIMWSMGRIETVKSIENDDRYCILDQGEGLISRIMHLTTPSFDENALNLYLQHVPNPDVLVYLNTDLEIIYDRVKNRKRSSSLHDGMSDSDILQYTEKTDLFLRKASDYLEKEGADVYRVDSSQTIGQVISQIVEIFSSKADD